MARLAGGQAAAQPACPQPHGGRSPRAAAPPAALAHGTRIPRWAEVPNQSPRACGRCPLWVSVQNLHLCEGYTGPDGRYHPGFYCPRLSDPAGHRFCCRPSPRALKSCCSQVALEALTGLNASSLAGRGVLRHPLALPFAGLYGLLILLLMAVDLIHFCRTRHCRLSRFVPCTCRPPCGPRPPASRVC
ncbi:protein shisa-like-1a [Phaenicophaeus curvirostris]|uniref:protein shisa-like-1a n=1 Tax=Phaenicophaeus curvirostris TaxID=33595 RepID=UPI0037F0B511